MRVSVFFTLCVGMGVGVGVGVVTSNEIRKSEPVIADDYAHIDALGIDEYLLDFFPNGQFDNMRTDVPGDAINPSDFASASAVGVQFDAVDTSKEADPIEMANLFEGDIVADSKELLNLKKIGQERNAIVNMDKRWPNGVIPYVISNAYNQEERVILAKAMSEYHSKTCLRFIPRTVERDYIHILKGDGCSSAVGRSGNAQQVSLGTGCIYVGIVMHELMHAAGFWHEQSRSDRDGYITINRPNIIPGMEYNFDKYSWQTIQNLGVEYDTGSIMHYGAYAFALKRDKPTIIPHDTTVKIGQRDAFSERDISKLNLLYQCPSTGVPQVTVTTTSPITPPTSKTCVDSNTNCAVWATLGECDKNPAWMSVNCAKACKKCGEDCKDQNENCDYWRGQNECVLNSAYMTLFCKKSCGACHTSSDLSSKCEDKNEHCAAWKDKGNCRTNPNYMLLYCEKSCGQCKK